jgi:hypothetical protein
MTRADSPAETRRGWGSWALSLLGAAVIALGVAEVTTQAHPTRGKAFLLAGAVTVLLGPVLRERLSPRRQRELLLVVVVLALLAALEAFHVFQFVQLSHEIVPV